MTRSHGAPGLLSRLEFGAMAHLNARVVLRCSLQDWAKGLTIEHVFVPARSFESSPNSSILIFNPSEENSTVKTIIDTTFSIADSIENKILKLYFWPILRANDSFSIEATCHQFYAWYMPTLLLG